MQAIHFLLAGVATLGVTLAQDARRASLPATAVNGTGIATTPDGVIAGGRNWEARFRGDVVEFLPVLGERAPRTLPLRWQLQSIRRGETLLHSATASGKPEPATGGVTIARSAGIAERYLVRADGLEQTFVFPHRLAGSGDLVVTLQIDSELPGVPTADGGLAFTLPGIGGVHFGAVTGIDANGRKAAGNVRLADRTIELSLPAGFVEDATFPLVLDPLVGTQFDVTGGSATYDDSESDAAYDASNDRYLVVWRRKFSATYSLIRGQMLTGAGAASGSTMFFVPSGTAVQKHARVCSVNALNRFVIVWEEAPTVVGPRDIFATTVLANDGSQGAVVGLLTTSDDENSPCIGGDATVGDDEALLCWMDSTNIRAQQVTVSATGATGLAGAAPALGSAVFARDLAVSRSGGATGRLVAAWTRLGFLADSEIELRALTRDAALIGSTFTTANAVGDRAPAIDGDGNRFVLAWERDESGGGNTDVVCQSFEVSGTTLASTGSVTPLSANTGASEATPDVCCLGAKFAVFWQYQFSSFFDDIYGQVLGPDCTTCGPSFLFGGLNRTSAHNYEFAPRCVGRYSGSIAASANGLMTFSEGENAPPFESDVIAQRFYDDELEQDLGGGCGVGGTIHSSCLDVGNGSFSFTLSRAATSTPAFLMLAYTRNDRTCGACTLIPDVWNGYVGTTGTNAFGNAAYYIAVPATAALSGSSLLAQYAVTGSNCFLGGFDFSNGIRATIQ
ncbi:MAG: hypothetical protein IPK26_16180 [Planctomycetes bacterium]|nr:hypothetical protein [Planctomycetota bacterium]